MPVHAEAADLVKEFISKDWEEKLHFLSALVVSIELFIMAHGYGFCMFSNPWEGNCDVVCMQW